jgi:hypothetical protein
MGKSNKNKSAFFEELHEKYGRGLDEDKAKEFSDFMMLLHSVADKLNDSYKKNSAYPTMLAQVVRAELQNIRKGLPTPDADALDAMLKSPFLLKNAQDQMKNSSHQPSK